MTLESFFPNQDYPFVTTQQRHDPYLYVESIERWRKSGRPIRFILTETPLNIAFAIENFTYGERDGSGDVYYVLELKEYVFTGVKEVNDKGYNPPTKSETSTSNNRDNKSIGNTYTVKVGDTLSAIAKKQTGNSANYKIIAEKNNIKNPNKISIGQVIKL